MAARQSGNSLCHLSGIKELYRTGQGRQGYWYADSLRYEKMLYMLDWARTTACSRNQHATGHRGEEKYWFMSEGKHPLRSHSLWAGLQEAISVLAWSSSQVQHLSHYGKGSSPQTPDWAEVRGHTHLNWKKKKHPKGREEKTKQDIKIQDNLLKNWGPRKG